MNARVERELPDLNGRILVTSEELAAMLACGKGKAEQIGRDANAMRRLGRSVRWNIQLVREYALTTVEM